MAFTRTSFEGQKIAVYDSIALTANSQAITTALTTAGVALADIETVVVATRNGGTSVANIDFVISGTDAVLKSYSFAGALVSGAVLTGADPAIRADVLVIAQND